MDDMNRRDFVIAAFGGISLLGGAGTPAFESDSRASLEIIGEGFAQPGVHTRKNIYCLSESSADLKAYRAAVAAMKARPVSDGTSWMAQANIHGAVSAPSGMIANACRHDQLFFLSWHRMYVHFFERIARKASGDPSFALPYWGYSPTGARNLPVPFRDPALASNVLFVANPGRRASINAGADLAASVVDSGVAMAQPLFGGFSSQINGTPHGVVHTGVGGGGLMSAFETAAQDPIFWLHHCNIDRLWERWLAGGSGHANPTTDSAWMTQPFDFYDENGARVPLRGSEIVNIAAQLKYRYASESCRPIGRPELFTRIPPYDPRMFQLIERIRVRPPRPVPGPGPIPPLAQSTPVRLGAAPAAVRLAVSAEAKRTIDRFPDDPRGGRDISIGFRDIKVQGTVDVYYEVYVNLPDNTRDTVYTSPHYAGNLDFFGPSPRRAGAQSHDRVLSILPTYVRLRSLQQWPSGDVRVTLVPRAYTEAEPPARLLGRRTQAEIGRVQLVVQ